MSSLHRRQAVAALFAELDLEGVRFPGTRLRMLRFAVAAALQRRTNRQGLLQEF